MKINTYIKLGEVTQFRVAFHLGLKFGTVLHFLPQFSRPKSGDI